MTLAFHCRASGRHIGLDELEALPLPTLERWDVHKFYCPFCGNYANELPKGEIKKCQTYEYG